MPSPFPGMNPFLEQDDVWHDFHERFCPLAAELLTAQVRPHFIVKIDEHVFVHELPDAARRFLGRSDVGVARRRAPAESSVQAATLAAPAEVALPVMDFERLSFVEIRDRAGGQLVSVVELLSPSNKYAGLDRELYLAKRSEVLASPVHLVEIDLLRGGPRMPMEGLEECDYCVLVSRADTRPRGGVWPLRLTDRLPVIPVPLQPPHEDARLDLQAILHRIYDAAGYEDYIYQGQPRPRLSAEQAAWAQPFVPKAS